MGSRGPVALASSTRENRDRPAVQNGLGLSEAPRPSKKWLAGTTHAWDNFLDSELTGVLTDVDVPALRRLFTFYDLAERASRAWYTEIEEAIERGYAQDEALVDVGAKGDRRPNVHLQTLDKLERMISALEQRFGITPLVRARLGIDMGEAKLTAEKVSKVVERKDRPGRDA